MKKAMDGPALHGYLAGPTFMGPDCEDFVEQGLSSVSTVVSHEFNVSNLGVFLGQDTSTRRRWKIDDMQFSAATIHSRVGWTGPVFNVAGVKGGDTVINANFEEGVLPRALVEDVLAATMARLEALIV